MSFICYKTAAARKAELFRKLRLFASRGTAVRAIFQHCQPTGTGFHGNVSEEERDFLQKNQGSKMPKKPPKPPSPFTVFVQTHAQQNQYESVIERTKTLAKRWKEMGEQERELYREESRKAKEMIWMQQSAKKEIDNGTT